MINPGTGVPVYRQLADLIRRQIETGQLRPGQRLRAEPDYMDEYGISRTSVRQAMAMLRAEGLITTTRRGSRVRAEHDVDEVAIGADTRVRTRMPSAEERQALNLAEGIPVFVIERDGAEPEILPGDRTVLVGD
ncbi:GntR family transcriptional regulator [Microbispora sp. GKU 823]|uniref:GntR family transcriptional regulator n=1 Tax=Microbispora sp. GKU 823 TaxID=1652100 RepID=UPI0009A3E30F|nr:winged helix-turn-helix domain-containing protein [Microbispora sp. GKU 823]OPG10594.1 hypothetical protein B1L11_23335 [Microbispora sp. GKU 823]